ncbi:unnamed protein product [Clavelina lepadiformis]|uniref:Cytochrome P450 n=1 Tax=Clavelina lepadiformis TaxID=159417 RepID=A0ABP0GH32_CLALP
MAPFLRKIPPFSSTYKSGMKLRESLHDEIREEIKRHQETLDLDNPRDFIDHFLNEMNKRALHNDATKSEEEISIKPSVEDDEEISSDWERYSSFHLNQLKSLVRDLFLAGTDTTANAVAWLIIYLCKYPEVQVKLQNEIDSVFGTDGVPAMSKMRQLPYLRAIIQETSRIRPIVPLSLPHKASRDAKLLGYCIPKGAIILTNIWAIHHDETKWPDPETFLPERHLDDGGNFVKSSDWMVFGVGPRGCLGQQLAYMELCIMTVLLFRRFTFSLAPGEQPDMAGRSGIILKPPDPKVIAQRRNG